jgi:ArsR family transcriptional regulator, virulence genes transcriptional regulator
MSIAPASEKKRVRMLPAMAEMREHATNAAAFLKALGNDQRLLVLCALLDGELSVGEINERVPLSQSALSQHLGVLREAGLVTTTRQSQTIYYAIAPGPALQIMQVLYETFCAPSGSGAAPKKAKCSPPKRS